MKSCQKLLREVDEAEGLVGASVGLVGGEVAVGEQRAVRDDVTGSLRFRASKCRGLNAGSSTG